MSPPLARAVLAAAAVAACQQEPVTLPLRSLEGSGDVAFLCMDPDDPDGHPGRDIDDCPDFAEGKAHLYGLVTQMTRGEVAVLDLSAGAVVDNDPSTPGFNFLPVGAQPRDIVSTPGGSATFVGVAEPGREGIYALPSSCILPPARDLLSWPACALPSAPGDMFVLIDPARAATGEPRSSCLADPPPPAEAIEHDCRVDLGREPVDGRHKLAVVMPREGMLAILDAQRLLDRIPGSFDECPVERWVPLRADVPANLPAQRTPPELVAPGCDPTPLNHGPEIVPAPAPAGGTLDGDTLYVADRGAPVVHVLDVSDPCRPVERPPLLPVSWTDPGRTVTTSAVAVSPTTSDGRRFAYAVDDFDGSVMIFDVSGDSSERTPIVRRRSGRFPFEPPDRLAFSSPAIDVELVGRDRPIVNDTTGVALVGEACEPDYRKAGPDAPAALHRPSPDLSDGAGPGRLRGVFGFLLLRSGQVAVIDVDDYDAPCRRPVEANPVAEGAGGEDFRGCADGADAPGSYTLDGTPDETPTVTGEVSCHVVERHRARSAVFARTTQSGGVRAPGIRSFPRLKLNGATLPTDQTDDGRQNPKMLAVGFEGGQSPRLFVGTTLHVAGEEDEDELVLSPAEAENNSLVLDWSEPRAFAAEEDYTAVYEGEVVGQRSAGILTLRAADPKLEGLVDAGGSFCSKGVQDFEAVKKVAQRLGTPSAAIDAFARRHADYVQITQPLPDRNDGYWKSGVGASCGGAVSAPASFLECRTEFGPAEVPTDSRDLRILEAYQDQLVVEPRRTLRTAAERERLLGLLGCCFPTALSYRVRAGHQWVVTGNGVFRHDIQRSSEEGPRGKRRCVHDCNPLRSLLTSRAFEITCSGGCGTNASGIPAVGAPRPEEILDRDRGTAPCTILSPDELLTRPDHPCIFRNLTHRFAIYRGARLDDEGRPKLSERGMTFTWKVVGGFRPLLVNLAGQTSAVTPQSMVFVPQLGRLAVVDPQSEGLALLSLESLGSSRLFF